ncbi:DNA polymerase I [Litorivicinus lipolyticus]|uniref:DNA polymerase I n=1 Tax=Litorivicinus lipolyticus TaxID=418701 RepID=UPI003B59CD69
MTQRPDIVLVDGSSYLYRAFHAMPPLTNSQGQPVGATRGILNMLKKLFDVTGPVEAAVIFDAPGKTFRDQIYPDYKANRPSMPDDLRAQIKPIHALVEALGLPLIMVPDVEADDVIGTLAAQYAAQGKSVLVSTGDKDMAQLVDQHVTLVNTMGDPWTYMDPAGVVEKFGVPPERIIDFLALVGDKVDNVPGVEKCGPKTAVKWLQAYGSLDGVMANADQVGGKVGEYLRVALDFLPTGRDLVTIKLDCEWPAVPLVVRAPDTEALRALYQELEFTSLMQTLEPSTAGASAAPSDGVLTPAQAPNAPAQTHYQLIENLDDLDTALAACRQAGTFALDTETTSVHAHQADLVGVALSWAPGQGVYIPVAHQVLEPQLAVDEIRGQLQALLKDPGMVWVAQNLKYDLRVLRRAGFTVACQTQDTLLMSYALNPTGGRHDMDSMATRYLGVATTSYETVCGKGAKQVGFETIDLATATAYAAEDADITLRLYRHLSVELARAGELKALYESLELPLVPVIADLEDLGALIDPDALALQSAELGLRLEQLEDAAHDLAGEPFNLSSPKQLQAILFEKLGLPVLKKTPKGAPSTNEEVLAELAEQYELPKLLMEHRSLSKLKGTYTDKLPLAADANGRIHTSLHQAVTSTGRLSSSDPNLQNIPIRTEEGRRIRAAFIAPAGHVLMAADYSQVELRVMAHFSQDPGMIAAFQADQDIHSATAAEVFGVDTVTADHRRAAKAINFGLIYGMSAFGLARNLHISRGEAQDYIDRYFARYPGVLRFMETTKENAQADGYVATQRGRRLYLPDINGRDQMRKRAAERLAINAPVQGTAADLIKQAMLDVDALIRRDFPDVRMLLQVHDELLFEVPLGRADAFAAALKPAMEGVKGLDVPLKVDIGRGASWYEAH